MRDVGVFVMLEGYWCERGTWPRKEWRTWRGFLPCRNMLFHFS
jgi:hypothetical protein